MAGPQAGPTPCAAPSPGHAERTVEEEEGRERRPAWVEVSFGKEPSNAMGAAPAGGAAPSRLREKIAGVEGMCWRRACPARGNVGPEVPAYSVPATPERKLSRRFGASSKSSGTGISVTPLHKQGNRLHRGTQITLGSKGQGQNARSSTQRSYNVSQSTH